MNKREKQVGAGDFKTHCLQLMDEVSKSRVPIVITKHGKPLVKLVPYNAEPLALFGRLRNTVVIHGDIIGPTGEVWEADV